MAFGIRTYDEYGRVNFDGGKRALRVIHYQVVPANFTGVISIPGVTPFNAAGVCIPRTDAPFDRNLNVTIGVDQVTLNRFNNSYPPKVLLDLIIFGYS